MGKRFNNLDKGEVDFEIRSILIDFLIFWVSVGICILIREKIID